LSKKRKPFSNWAAFLFLIPYSFRKKWAAENYQTFDGLWEKMKKEIFTKQEN
jgi:hypothetical protein